MPIRSFVKIVTIGASTCYLINSCGIFGSDYEQNASIPNQWSSNTTLYTNVNNLPYLAWWQQFDLTTLNNLIESGLQNNNDINIAMANLEQSRGYLKQVELSWIPGVGFYGGYSSNPAWGYPGTFYGVYPTFTLNIFQLIERQKQAKYRVKISEAAKDGVRLTIIGQIVGSYFTYLSQLYQLELLKDMDQTDETLVKITQQTVKVGLSQDISLNQIKTQTQIVKANIKVVEQNIKMSQNSLRYLINLNPGMIKTTDSFTKIDGTRFKPGALPATVLSNRPDFIEAVTAVNAAEEGINVSYGEFWPKMQLDTFVGNASGNNSFGNPNAYANLSDMYLTSGINASVFGEIEAKKGAYKAATYKYIQTIRGILRDVDNDFSANTLYSTRLDQIQFAFNDETLKYDLKLDLYKKGIIPYTELLKEKLIFDDLAITLNQTKIQQLMTLVALYQDLAGGYKVTSPNIRK